MTVLLRPGEQAALSAATGADPGVLSAMTLERYDQVAVSIDRERRTLTHPPAWRRHAGSRYCPACLRETGGRWQLSWRLPWTYACLIHSCLLADLGQTRTAALTELLHHAPVSFQPRRCKGR
jgi:hypothetical protein